MPNISRREALIFLAGATVTADIIWTSNWPEGRQPLTPEAHRLIQAEGERLQSSIGFAGFERGFTKTSPSTIYTPEPAKIAETLLQIGYIDGGESTLAKTADFVRRRGLTITVADTGGGVSGFNGLKAYAERPYITLDREMFENGYPNPLIDKTLWHEFYHLVQIARNPGERILMFGADLSTDGLSASATYLGIRRYLNLFTRRREGIKIAVAGAAAYGVYELVNTGLRPSEAQAYAQVEASSIEGLLDNRRGLLFITAKNPGI